jgi:hypothetical protein
MRGAIPPLPSMPSWRGAQLKHRDNFTFTCLTFRGEHGLCVSGNMSLRRLFGHKREEVTGSWKELHKEELSFMYSSAFNIRVTKSSRMKCEGHEACMGETRNANKIFVENLKGKSRCKGGGYTTGA